MKVASTALVRQIRGGALSPASITRAAGAMDPGKFRFVGNLGRGQFSVADKVVGNVGGHAGLMARKLPTHQVGTPEVAYGSMQTVANNLNQKFTPPGQAPWIAPIPAVNAKGMFQQMATGHVPQQLPTELKSRIFDVGPQNRGPNGQIADFQIFPHFDSLAPHARKFPDFSFWRRPRIDPSIAAHNQMGPTPTDALGNLGNVKVPPAQIAQAQQQMLPAANNRIRKYWALGPEQRDAYAAQLAQKPNILPDWLRFAERTS